MGLVLCLAILYVSGQRPSMHVGYGTVAFDVFLLLAVFELGRFVGGRRR